MKIWMKCTAVWLILNFSIAYGHAEINLDSQYSVRNSQQLRVQLNQKLADAQTEIESYQLEKALAWLTAADHEAAEKSNNAMGQHAYTQALKGIQPDSSLNVAADAPLASPVMRRDLWAQIESIKNQGSFRCSYKWIAQAEVNLIWAAAEYQELGWRHAREAFAAAERLVDRGSYESQQCGSNQ